MLSLNKKLHETKNKNHWFNNLNKYNKIFTLFLLSLIILCGLVYFGIKFEESRQLAKAEDISATTPVVGNFIGKLVLSPDNLTTYVSTSANSGGGIAKYDTTTNTLLGSISFTNNGIQLNSTGTRLYTYNASEVKVIDTASFTVISTIPVTNNIINGFLNADGSKFYAASFFSGATTTNTLTVIDTSNNTILTSLVTPQTVKGFYHHFSLDGSKLYLSDEYNGIVIDTATTSFEDFIPITKDMVLSEDGKKMYSFDTANFDSIGMRVIDLATKKLDRVIFISRFVKAIPRDGKIFVIADNALKIYDAQTYNLLSTTQIINSTSSICSSGCGIKITPDGSKLYITAQVGGSFTYIGNPANNNAIIVPPDNILLVMDLNSFEININQNFSPSPRIEAFSNDGKKAYVRDVGSYKVVDTTLVNTSDISGFSCTSPTNNLGSVVTCNVTSSTPVRGLVKFTVGLEECTAYFAAAGDTTANCTYIANNVQNSPITIQPSFGTSLSSGSLIINGEAGDVVISSGNIVTNNNCVPSGNVRIGVFFDCSFSLTGSSSNSYILPSQGIKIGVGTVPNISDFCTLSGNGTANVKLDCKDIPTTSGVGGNPDVLAFINGSSTGSSVGSINLTDGYLVNSTSDDIDSAPGDGYCGNSLGECTLRAAVMEANTDYIKDKINIPAGVYQLTIAPTVGVNKGAIDGDLDITTDMDFVGAGKDTTFIQAGSDDTNGIDRVFHIFNTNVDFNNLTIRYGRVNNLPVGTYYNGQNNTTELPQNGGGIYYQKYLDFNAQAENSIAVLGFNDDSNLPVNADESLKFPATLNLNNVVVSNNYAQNSGGGIYDSSRTSIYTNSEINNNSSGKYGGGVSRSTINDRVTKLLTEQAFASSSATLNFVNSIVSGNQSVDGAGIYHDRGNKVILDENTRLLGNIASGNGGGIFNTECSFFGGVSTITINGSTINSNSAVNGGGVYNECGHVETLPGNLTTKNSTIQYNSASEKGAAWFGANSSLNELTKSSIYENNTQNPALTYATGQVTSVMWFEGSSNNFISQSMFLGNWGRSVEFNNGARVDIKETTISNNSGRGVSYTNGSTTGNTTLKIVNSTISSNNSSGISFRSSAIDFQGSHLTIANNAFGFIIDPAANVRLDNTIITGSFFVNCGDLTGALLTNTVPGGSGRGKNLSNNSDCDNIFGFTANPDVQTFLGPLQFNGGPTVTIALLAGSPAIDEGAGSANYDGYPESPNIDQRGFTRPSGLNYDIGAYEEGGVLFINPQANDDNASTDSNTSVSINLLANDDGGTNGIDTNSVNISSSPNKGSLNDYGNGEFEYVPDSSQFTSSDTDTFTYYFLDQNGIQSNTATVTINVGYITVNIAPVAAPDVTTTLLTSSILIDVASNDTDSDGTLDLGSVTIVTSPAKGSANINSNPSSPDFGKITYTPNPAFFASASSDTFEYVISDNNGSVSNVAIVTIDVTLPPQPIANPDNASTLESTPVTVDVLANDVNSTNICANSVSTSANGTATILPANGTTNLVDKILFTPNIGFNGNATFTYTACSTVVGTSPSSPASVTVAVNAVNPVAVNDTATADQNNAVTINVLANDTDPSGQTITICSPLSSPSNGTISKTIIGSVEQIIFTPTAGYNGQTSFTYTACDPAGNASNIATVTVNVIPNILPVANPDSGSTVSSSPVTINPTSNDTDSDGFLDLTSVTIVANPTKGSVSVNATTGIIIYTATTSLFTSNGTDSFTYKIKDDDNEFSNEATISISVLVDPTANNDTASGLVSSAFVLDVAANDQATSAPLDLSSINIITQPTKGTVSVNTTANSPDFGKVIYTPTASAYSVSGSDSFSYTIEDTEGHVSNPATATVNVTVPPANQIPVANNDTTTGGKFSVLTIDVAANDTDNDGTLDLSSVAIVTQPTKGTVSVNTTANSPDFGKVIYTPTASSYTSSSTDSFTYRIRDNDGDFSSPATVTVNIILLLPTAVNDTVTLDINTPTTVDVLANDILATSICASSVFSSSTNGSTALQTSSGGSVAITADNKIIYTPANNFTGTDSFVYKACNNDGESNVSTVNLTVNALPIEAIVPPTDSTITTTNPTAPVVNPSSTPVAAQSVEITLYKEKQDADILLNQPLKIQADIKNPNNFIVAKIETIINIDTTKLNFVANSAKEGSIVGNKYLGFLELYGERQGIYNLASLLSIPTKAQASTTPTVSFEVISSSQLKVTILNAQPNQTLPIVFDVLPKANLQNSIQAKADIIDPVTNLSIATASSAVNIAPTEPILNVLVRTGGQTIVQLSLGVLVALMVFVYMQTKREKIKINLEK